MKHAKFSLDDDHSFTTSMAKKISESYAHIPSTEIWHLENITSTLRQVEFYFVTGNFTTPAHAFLILDKLEELLNHIELQAEYGKKFQVLEDTTVVPFVKNVAAQTLLFLVGAQPKVPPPVSHRFDSMLESVKNRVSGCADKLGFTEKEFCNMAETILGRRNHTIHPESVVELAELTKQAVEMVNAFPNIVLVCRSEVTILRAYEEISLFFP